MRNKMSLNLTNQINVSFIQRKVNLTFLNDIQRQKLLHGKRADTKVWTGVENKSVNKEENRKKGGKRSLKNSALICVIYLDKFDFF